MPTAIKSVAIPGFNNIKAAPNRNNRNKGFHGPKKKPSMAATRQQMPKKAVTIVNKTSPIRPTISSCGEKTKMKGIMYPGRPYRKLRIATEFGSVCAIPAAVYKVIATGGEHENEHMLGYGLGAHRY
jgi:hypothetical protein